MSYEKKEEVIINIDTLYYNFKLVYESSDVYDFSFSM